MRTSTTRTSTTRLLAVAATLMATVFGVWAASPASAPSTGQRIEPFKLMMNAKDLSRAELVDYTFVFH